MPYGPGKSRTVAALQSATLPGFRRRRRRAVFAFGSTAPLALVLVAAACAGRPPAGQPEVRKLSVDDLPAFREEFNAASDKHRVLTLLSPT
jgi:hypothetical protein